MILISCLSATGCGGGGGGTEPAPVAPPVTPTTNSYRLEVTGLPVGTEITLSKANATIATQKAQNSGKVVFEGLASADYSVTCKKRVGYKPCVAVQVSLSGNQSIITKSYAMSIESLPPDFRISH